MFIERGKRKANPFEVWGDGEQVRDFIHIRDVVDAVDAAIANDIIGPVNLGS
ncbi:MAG: NAD-dependent epimerase/dehydratase family protein, partial [Actinobacteria bacterium]|nr:NAD-dependent epimerase/dehydratase family protein [Actinomycetota bacterium]